jgi:hypothetical protein
MSTLVGFTILTNGTQEQTARAKEASARVLAFFPDIHKQAIVLGETTLEVWGRGNFTACTHMLPDGTLLARIGSPTGDLSWKTVEEALLAGKSPQSFQIPWEGRAVLLHIHADGKTWDIRNDWMGSIPVFFSYGPGLRIASTLEPAVVAAAQFTPEDFFLPGVASLFIHGNLLSDWTIYKNMHTIQPDSVTTFDEAGVHSVFYNTVPATDDHWETAWDDLVDEMHHLVDTAVGQVLETQPAWTLPLSGGLDSRMIAAVSAEKGANVKAFTWGPATTQDGIFSRRVASALGFPWQRIDLPEDYLDSCLPMWVSLFGSSLHFHGMYQIPFIQHAAQNKENPILTGYLGDPLAGNDVVSQTKLHPQGKRLYTTHPYYYLHWQVEEMKALFRFPIDKAIEELADLINSEKNRLEGPWYQKLRFLNLWGRQNHFIHFQSMLSDYACGVATPFMNRAYARFCLSLPRVALDNRRLQIDMMQRHYRKVMTVGGTFSIDPIILTGQYLLKRRFASKLPEKIAGILFPEYHAQKNIKTDVASMIKCGRKAMWPIDESAGQLSKWIDLSMVDEAFQQVMAGDISGVRKIQSVQAFAYRLDHLRR